MQSSNTVDWPTDDVSGDVFDDAWLDLGTRVELTDYERLRVTHALATGGQEPDDGQTATKAQVREYWRIKTARQLHENYLAMESPARDAATVRGRGLQEWRQHIDHLKRTGHLRAARDLTGECVSAAISLLELGEPVNVEKWLVRSAVILRKMGDHAGEVELIEGVLASWPHMSELAARLPQARRTQGPI